ncbi:hypothetical protein C2E23DRAFT_902065 [Lenzites betulinus]|nr:hypothetical protein C2E23DRAFT_902065 [Lenzites betulinus]
MDRPRRSPPQRHSSLPASLHRLMVAGPAQPPQDVDEDDAEDGSQQRPDAGARIPLHGALAEPVHPASAPADPPPPLPPLHLTAGPAFGGLGVPIHPRTLCTDPAYYASAAAAPSSSSAPAAAALAISPPGPQLRPISWSPESAPAAGRGQHLTHHHHPSPDRSAPPLPRTPRHPSPIFARGSIAATRPSLPVAGPSRPSAGPPAGGRTRRTRGRAARAALGPPEAAAAGGSAAGAPRRRGASESEHDFSSAGSARAPSIAVLPPASGAGAAQWGEEGRRPEAGPSSRRIPESARGSAASLTAENYPVAVGATAYSVTTLSPLRATILPPAGAAAGARAGGWRESASSGAGAGPSGARAGGSQAEVKRSESDTEGEGGAAGGKRRRRRGASASTSSGTGTGSSSSSSSEQAQAPKSKKTLIACHFCRARKLRCDGQRPSCANCRKRAHPCTYESQPKRRGPGKAPRAATAPRTRRTRRRPNPDAGAAAGVPGPDAAGPSNADAASAPASLSTATAPGPAQAPVAAALGQVPPGPFPMARHAFEPQLTGPIPTYPGFAYRAPSAPGLPPPFYGARVGRGMSRSVASDSVRSSNASNVSSVPDSEEPDGADGSVHADADEYMDYTDLPGLFRRPGPGEGEGGSR